ncbi:MAG: helix-turn-helix domain-containing protein [Patescibacteria group bacterium]|nr:helix-turn-helix domain-containing protein [Patescibacteria group bacterium]
MTGRARRWAPNEVAKVIEMHRAGVKQSVIAAEMKTSRGRIGHILREAGAKRKPTPRQFSVNELAVIQTALSEGESLRQIATRIGRTPQVLYARFRWRRHSLDQILAEVRRDSDTVLAI